MTASQHRIWMAVPTYWTYPTSEDGPKLTAFDHPTQLDTEGTLARTLESFRVLADRFEVVIPIGVAHPSLAARAYERVCEVVAPFRAAFPITVVGQAQVDAMNREVGNGILALSHYGDIRNVQLAVPYALGATVVVGIDDDEIIEDAGFLAKVTRFIGRSFVGDVVGGMAGPYFDAAGDYRIGGAEALRDCPNMFEKKNFFMNEALKKAMGETPADGIKRCNVAFGGNMCMSRDTIKLACHDPAIARGEDYDYVITAKMAGINFYFQPSMRIVHLPPDSTGSQAADHVSKLQADINRFIYMQEKQRVHGERFPAEAVDIAYLMPYPGPYVAEALDLEAHAVDCLERLYPAFCKHTDPRAFARQARQRAKDNAPRFFEYRERWRALIRELEDNAGVRALFRARAAA